MTIVIYFDNASDHINVHTVCHVIVWQKIYENQRTEIITLDQTIGFNFQLVKIIVLVKNLDRETL